ncbi:hypothetical protein J4050_00500 [Winogradskyella sp. DF17]|uniref:Uncharacterized protein n=1 Tax=Winogradskyella pelagia TaxID=2819984 RepID=A0ABS3SYB1_9FLAO|nr:hypothetical protein [Winogradskyella sp. DF17]MBO3115204.1 hypothetical protein [Winogradskyella sp. DF17]
MKLTKAHIDQLYTFTQKHYVEWYDVQTELVDHLANGIEAQLQDNPKLSFEEALDIEFKKFGVFGFMDVVSETEKSMGKHYRRFLFAEVKEWFKVPQFIATLSLFLFFLMIFKSELSEVILLGFYVLFVLWIGYKTILLNRAFNKRRKTAKKWLLEHIIFQQASGVVFVGLLNIFNVFNLSSTPTSTVVAIFVSALFTFAVIISVISLQILPSKANELLKETYPTFVTN